jgi:hypothetical protein
VYKNDFQIVTPKNENKKLWIKKLLSFLYKQQCNLGKPKQYSLAGFDLEADAKTPFTKPLVQFYKLFNLSISKLVSGYNIIFDKKIAKTNSNSTILEMKK